MSDFANSSKLILSVLDSNRRLSQKEISAFTGVPERTVRHGLKRLMEKGLVRELVVWSDLRQKLFERGEALCLKAC
ncbi:MAG: winged helix-turn-helix domain-containing protein [Candidatus Diapherotrites archaeon]|nr:winged helix-turn-helix domain-containing protein [Candidatus Diapherotrites archaeon]